MREAISQQVAMVAQLRHIVSELAATRRPAAQKAAHLRALVSEHGAPPWTCSPSHPCPTALRRRRGDRPQQLRVSGL